MNNLQLKTMKIKFIYTFLIISFLGLQDIYSQSDRRLVGTWQSVSRMGNDPCKIDWTFQFVEKGQAILSTGEKFEQCPKNNETFDSWLSETQTQHFDDGSTKKHDVILLKAAGQDDLKIYVKEFVGDYMKVSIHIPSGDTIEATILIMKKLE